MTAGSFQVNAAAVMTNQPSDILFVPSRPATALLTTGATVAVARPKGARIVVKWGVKAARLGAYDELIADLGGNIGTRLRWEDPSGNTFDIQAVSEGVQVRYKQGGWFEPFTVTFKESPE